MKYVVYLVVALVLAGGAFFVRNSMKKSAENSVVDGAPTSAQYSSYVSAAAPSVGKFKFTKVEEIATAGRDFLGKETLSEWVQPLIDAGWKFNGVSEAALPGDGRSAVMQFEKDGKKVVLYGQVYRGIPDLSAHKGKALSLEAKAPLVDVRMFWGGGGVVYFATSDQAGAVDTFASDFKWPAVSGKW